MRAPSSRERNRAIARVRVGELAGTFDRLARSISRDGQKSRGGGLAKLRRDLSSCPTTFLFVETKRQSWRARGLNQSLLHLEAGGKTQF